MDDFAIFSGMWKECLQHLLHTVFKRLKDTRLRVKSKKYLFFMEQSVDLVMLYEEQSSGGDNKDGSDAKLPNAKDKKEYPLLSGNIGI